MGVHNDWYVILLSQCIASMLTTAFSPPCRHADSMPYSPVRVWAGGGRARRSALKKELSESLETFPSVGGSNEHKNEWYVTWPF